MDHSVLHNIGCGLPGKTGCFLATFNADYLAIPNNLLTHTHTHTHTLIYVGLGITAATSSLNLIYMHVHGVRGSTATHGHRKRCSWALSYMYASRGMPEKKKSRIEI